MKKLFLFAAASLAMLAGCQKTEISGNQSNVIDDSKPVAMQFGVNAPSFEVTKTKAAVDGWNVNGTPIQVIGLINTGTADAPVYDFTAKVFDQAATVTSSATPIELYQQGEYAGKNVPYFYSEGKLYDFYAYHLGGADAEAQDDTTKANTITRKVTIDGSQDLMVAQPDKAEDIKADTSLDGVTTADVYSAWAARRGVQPTLVFEHALTRFNFIVRGMDTPATKVTIDGISMTGLAKTGTLTVVGETLGFTAGDVVENDNTLSLKNIDDTPYTPQDVVMRNEVPAGNGSCLMVEPGLKKINVVVDMHHTYAGAMGDVKIDLDPYTFTVDATQVLKEGVAAGITTFAAGTAYNIYINVYGPQEIIIKAELTEWANGGDYTYDPDQQRPGGETTSVTAKRTVVDNVITYAITYSSDITALQGAIATARPDDDSDAWKSLVDTRAATGISYTLAGSENAEDFKLWVRYTTEETTEWVTPATPVEANIITKSYLVTESEESYNQLPEAYRSAKGDWSYYLASKEVGAPEFNALPWLAVEVNPGTVVTCTATNGETTKTLSGTARLGVITFSAKEMELDTLTPGEWTVTVEANEEIDSATIIVPAE